MSTRQKKNSLDKIDLAIKLILVVMALCSAGIATALVIGFRQHIW